MLMSFHYGFSCASRPLLNTLSVRPLCQLPLWAPIAPRFTFADYFALQLFLRILIVNLKSAAVIVSWRLKKKSSLAPKVCFMIRRWAVGGRGGVCEPAADQAGQPVHQQLHPPPHTHLHPTVSQGTGCSLIIVVFSKILQWKKVLSVCVLVCMRHFPRCQCLHA